MPGILSGIRVIDLTRNVAGPFCTMTLADLGADVIKVERPETGDDTREWRPPSWDGYSATYLSFNRNKRSLAVDLDTPDGQAIVRRLVEGSDVLVESFRPGSLAKRGLDYEALSQENPGLVFCLISGFGTRGPERLRPAYDPVIQAFCGIMSITGDPSGPPVRTGPAVVDMGAGLWGAFGIVAALFERQHTGRGRLVETSLLETGLGWLSYHLAGYLGSGVVPTRNGSKGMIAAPYETFATADEFLFLAAPNDQMFERLCRTLDTTDLLFDARFSSNPSRVTNRDALHALLEVRFVTASARHWEELLLAQELPCSRIRSVDQVATDPQVASLGMMLPIAHHAIPELRHVNLPVSFDGTRAVSADAPPELGEHTDDILLALGYDGHQVETWRRSGVIGRHEAVGDTAVAATDLV